MESYLISTLDPVVMKTDFFLPFQSEILAEGSKIILLKIYEFDALTDATLNLYINIMSSLFGFQCCYYFHSSYR